MYLEINVCILKRKDLQCLWFNVTKCFFMPTQEVNIISFTVLKTLKNYIWNTQKLARGEIPSSAVLYTFRHGSSETHHTAWHHLTAHPPGWWRTCHPSQDLPSLLIAAGHLHYSLLIIHMHRPLIPFKYVSLHARLRLLLLQLSLHLQVISAAFYCGGIWWCLLNLCLNPT